MKYIKKFEDEKYFDVGDYIKCTSKESFMTGISIGTVYKIEGFRNDSTVVYAVIHNDNNKTGWYRIKQFVEATPEEIKNYHIKKDSDKYNL